MPPELALNIVEQVFVSDKPAYRATLAACAEGRKVRPVFLERQPRADRHKQMLSTLSRPALEAAAANLIRTWLLKVQSGMLADFLDRLNIPHKDGVVEELPASIEDEKLLPAVETLVAKYPKEHVAVYLHAFNSMNETNWSNLNDILDKDQRLQF